VQAPLGQEVVPLADAVCIGEPGDHGAVPARAAGAGAARRHGRLPLGAGRTSRLTQELRRSDGTIVATVESVGGILDLHERRLLPDPGTHWRKLATRPEVLGL
jgi:hypothetical protein